MAIKVELPFVENDRLEELFFEFEDVDVSTYTSIRLFVRLESGLILMFGANPYQDAIVVDAAAGKFRFEWPASGVPRGEHTAEVEFVDASGKTETFPPPPTGPLILVTRGRV